MLRKTAEHLVADGKRDAGIVWVEPLGGRCDIGACGRARVLDDGMGAYVDVVMLTGDHAGSKLAIPRDGVLGLP